MIKFWNVLKFVASAGAAISGSFAFAWMFLVLGDAGPDMIWDVAFLVCAAYICVAIFCDHMIDVYTTREERTSRVKARN